MIPLIAGTLGICWLARRPRAVPRNTMLAVLLTVFMAAFVLAPWWYFYPSMILRWGLLTVVMLAGFILSFFSSGDLEVDPSVPRHPVVWYLALAAGLLLIHVRTLVSDIVFMGDEDFHIGVVLTLKHFVTVFIEEAAGLLYGDPVPALTLLAVLGGSAVYRIVKKRSVVPVLLAGLIVAAIGYAQVLMSAPVVERTDALSAKYGLPFFTVDHFLQYEILRYPILQKWADLFFAVWNSHGGGEAFRVVPFLSVLFLAIHLFVQFYQKFQDRLLSMFASWALVTMPLVVYYTGILYPDMAAATLLSVAAFDLRALLRAPFSDLKRRPAWYLLILASFIKETSLISLAVIMGVRLVCRGRLILRESKPLAVAVSAIGREGLTCLLPMIPVGCFLAIWSVEGSLRTLPSSFSIDHLLIADHYRVMAGELLAETGGVLLCAVTGAMILHREDRAIFWATALIFASNLLVFLSEGKYVGYSRFNLLLLPSIIYWAYFALARLRKKAVLTGVLLICAFLNLGLKPVHGDGSRVRNWGNPVFATGESTYPYDAAIRQLADVQDRDRLLIAGSSYPYYLIEYYMDRYEYAPESFKEFFFPPVRDGKIEEGLFYRFLKSVRTVPTRILYHSQQGIELDGNEVVRWGYAIDRKFSNRAGNTIYILKRIPIAGTAA